MIETGYGRQCIPDIRLFRILSHIFREYRADIKIFLLNSSLTMLSRRIVTRVPRSTANKSGCKHVRACSSTANLTSLSRNLDWGQLEPANIGVKERAVLRILTFIIRGDTRQITRIFVNIPESFSNARNLVAALIEGSVTNFRSRRSRATRN